MGASITFNYATWIPAYPQFINTPQPTIELVVVPLAQVQCRTDGGSPVRDQATLTVLFGLMVAHVTQLMFGSTIAPLTGVVGRVSQATQGSVSVSAEYNNPNPAAAWFLQTPYGAVYYQAISGFTLGVYAPRQVPIRRPLIYN